MSEYKLAEFNNIKSEGEIFYKSIGDIYCPFFAEKVSFNSKGLEHLKFKSRNHSRTLADQAMRFKLLKIAAEMIKVTRTVQGISEQKVFELNRSNHRNEYFLVNVTYYEFVAILQCKRVRVIVKQSGDAPKFFWSVIPFWKVDKSNGKRRMKYGTPEFD